MPSLLPSPVTAWLSREDSIPPRQSDPATGWRRGLRHPAAAPLLVGLLGLLISLFRIETPSVWYDEAATVISSTRSWAQLWDMIGTVDAVHALYYALIHVVFDVFGYSPLSLRIPSALAVGCAAALTVLIGRALRHTSFGVIAGLVFCILPRTTWVGTEGRSYAITTALAALLTLLLIAAIRRGTRTTWALYGVTIVLSCVLFLYIALVVVAHGVTVLAWYLLSRRGGQAGRQSRPDWASTAAPFLLRWCVSAGAATLVVIPFALVTMAQSQQLHWLDPLGARTKWHVFTGQWFYTSTPFAFVGWTLLAIGALALLRSPRIAAVLLPAFAVPTLALLAITVFYLPIYTPRYLTMCLPFVALVMAAGIAAIAGPSLATLRARGTLVLIGGLLVWLAVPQVLAQREPEAKENSSWREVSQLIAAERATDDPNTPTGIVYGGVQNHPIATARVIAYTYPEGFVDTVDLTIETPAAETGRLWETYSPIGDNLDRVADVDVIYLVASFSRDIRPETTEVLDQAGWHIDEAWDLTKVHVIRYVRD